MLVDAGIPSSTYNIVCRASLLDAKARVKETVGYFKSRDFPFTWWIGPTTKPSNLYKLLEKEGLRCDEVEVGMVKEPCGKIEGELHIESVITQEQHEIYAEFCARLSDEPAMVRWGLRKGQGKLKRYLGYLNNEPVVTGALMPAAGVAGLYDIVTLPEHRKHGLATNMIGFLESEAQHLGFERVVLQSTESALSLYLGLGFCEVCRFYPYVWSD